MKNLEDAVNDLTDSVQKELCQNELDEFRFLKFFYDVSDFGPADTDVRISIQERYEQEKGVKLPARYKYED